MPSSQDIFILFIYVFFFFLVLILNLYYIIFFRFKKENIEDHFLVHDLPSPTEITPMTRPRKWEQKQVQIRTLEGEFSVTMWASGTDDGNILLLISFPFFND